jgi:hypothetical protein
MLCPLETSIEPAKETKRTPVYQRADLTRLLHPASVAVIGASTTRSDDGHAAVKNATASRTQHRSRNVIAKTTWRRPCMSPPAISRGCAPRPQLQMMAQFIKRRERLGDRLG